MRKINLPTKADLYSVCSIDSGLVIVGDNGTMIHLNPITFDPVIVPVDRKLRLTSVCSFESETSVMAVGDYGMMVRWTTGDFKAIELNSGIKTPLNSICLIRKNSDKLVAVGPVGIITSYDLAPIPHTMHYIIPNAPRHPWLNSVCQDSSGRFYAVGNGGVMIYWDQENPVVTIIPTNTKRSLKSVCSVGQEGIVAVGYEGIMLWYHEGQTKIIPTGTNEWLTSVCSFHESIIVVGTKGTMIQWQIGDDEARPLWFLPMTSKEFNSVCSFEIPGISDRAFIVVGKKGTAFMFGIPWSIQDHSKYIPEQRNKIANILLSIKLFHMFLSVTSFI